MTTRISCQFDSRVMSGEYS